MRAVIARKFVPRSYQCGRVSCQSFSARAESNGSDLVTTSINEETKVATIFMNRPPVNSLSLELCQAISATIKEVEASSAQGLVLASSAPTILSAGLDLTELHNPDTERLPKFWKSFQQLFVDLYGSPLATVAAIEGHAPAGGCMLSMASDYRIMGAGEGKNIPRIGLNETQFGIVAPPWMAELLLLTVGHREGEKALSLGTLYSPDEALNIGLVDEVVPSEEVLARAQAEAAKWAKIPSMARAASKSIPRQPLLEKLIKTAEADTKQFVAFTTNDAVQQHLGRYLESLQRKK